MKAAVSKVNQSRQSDLYAWLTSQAEHLRARRSGLIDWRELAEELDEIVALAKKEVVGRLIIVLSHLLKWRYQPVRRGERSWRTSLTRERIELELLLDSKNLRNYLLDEGFARAYKYARVQAGAEMQLSPAQRQIFFPAACEWTLAEALDVDFYPSLATAANSRKA